MLAIRLILSKQCIRTPVSKKKSLSFLAPPIHKSISQNRLSHHYYSFNNVTATIRLLSTQPIALEQLSEYLPLNKATDRSQILPHETMPFTEYLKIRKSVFFPIRSMLRKNRFVYIGPYATISFENYDLIWIQIQEVLLIERAEEGQIHEELVAYNPLIPKGSNLVFTLMFEIEDIDIRLKALKTLGHIEGTIYLKFGKYSIQANSVDGHEMARTTSNGKTSAVHFLKFDFSPEQKSAFLSIEDSKVQVEIMHPNYSHSVTLGRNVLDELVKDFF